ncbi:MAG: hypothetical protein AAFV49_07805 [Pseudomonadota bacterium]
MSDGRWSKDVESYVDGEAGARASAIAAHIAATPASAALAREVAALNAALRADARRQRAPEALAARLERVGDSAGPLYAPEAGAVAGLCRPAGRSGAAPASRLSRRRVLGFGAAAAVAASAGVLMVGRPGGAGAQAMAPDVFGDFLTQSVADRPLDYTATDLGQVVSWFAPRLPFAMPALTAPPELSLRGARLCWLLERRIAAFDFKPASGAVSLYVADAEGLAIRDGLPLPARPAPAVSLERNGLAGAFWQDGTLAYALLGTLSGAAIAAIAAEIRTAG